MIFPKNESSQILKVGFIGLGDMGGAIAQRIIEAGFLQVAAGLAPTVLDQLAAECPKRIVPEMDMRRQRA
jgi:3-hydroxyisobutyrate dehydrogenase-like beta-hydroxyacid dehydrogenase